MSDKTPEMYIDEYLKLGEERFGKDRTKWKFVCPACGTVQTKQDFLDAGLTEEETSNMLTWSCIGRVTGKGSPSEEKGKNHGCNWTLGGLFQIAKLRVTNGVGDSSPIFELAEE